MPKSKEEHWEVKKRYRKTALGKQSVQRAYQKYTYGLIPKKRLRMYIDQNGCCAICKEAVSYSEILTDHNHTTGKIRGLLCRRCNSMLGGLDDSSFLQAAVIYLGENDGQ